MRSLRSVLGVIFRDKMRTEDIRERVETGNIVEQIRQYQRNSKEHAQIMTSEHLPRKEYCYSPAEKPDRPPRKS
jgi:hypothetical protein